MTSKIRILVADSSANLRQMIVAVAESQDDMQICASADNGQDAVAQYIKTQPDVIILNVSLPILDGPAAIKAIRALNANVPILVFCTASVRGGEVALQALSVGANDFITRPTQLASQTVMKFLETQLLPEIRTWHGRASLRGITASGLEQIRKLVERRKLSEQQPLNNQVVAATTIPARTTSNVSANLISLKAPRVVLMTSSTGGPNALRDVLTNLRPSLPVPVLIVQHMPEKFTRYLADRLNTQCGNEVREARDGDIVSAQTILIAPGGRHMALRRHGEQVVVQINDLPPVNSCRPSADILFQSAVDIYGEDTLGVVLTGMGSDGTDGCRQIKQAGGQVIAQDRDSCVVWGMPRSVTEAGLADVVLRLDQVAAQIDQSLPRPYIATRHRTVVTAGSC